MVGNKQTQVKLAFSPILSSPFSQVQLHSFFPNCPSSSPHPQQHRGMGTGGLWSVLNSSSLPLLPPHTFPLLQHQSSQQAAILQDKPAPVWALHRPQFLQGMLPISVMVPSTGCREYLLHRYPLHGWQGDNYNTFSTSSLPPSMMCQTLQALQMDSAASCGGSVGELPETSCVQCMARPCHRAHPLPTPCHKYEHDFQNTDLVLLIYRTKLGYVLIIKQ